MEFLEMFTGQIFEDLLLCNIPRSCEVHRYHPSLVGGWYLLRWMFPKGVPNSLNGSACCLAESVASEEDSDWICLIMKLYLFVVGRIKSKRVFSLAPGL